MTKIKATLVFALSASTLLAVGGTAWAQEGTTTSTTSVTLAQTDSSWVTYEEDAAVVSADAFSTTQAPFPPGTPNFIEYTLVGGGGHSAPYRTGTWSASNSNKGFGKAKVEGKHKIFNGRLIRDAYAFGPQRQDSGGRVVTRVSVQERNAQGQVTRSVVLREVAR